MKKLFLIPLIIIVVCGLIFGGRAKPAPAQPIKIGLLYPLTGPVAMIGELMVTSSKFGFEEVGYEVAGRKIEVIVEDSAALPDVALDKARKLIEYDKVCMIIGPLATVPHGAVAPYTSKMGVPQIVPSPSMLKLADHEWFFMAGGSKRQMVYPIGLYAYDKIGLRKVIVMTEDTGTGHTFLDAFMEAFKKRGGQVIQEQYPPFPCTDFAPYLASLKDADAVVAWFQGADAIRFHTQFHEFGIRKRMPLQPAYFGAFVQPFLMRKLPPEVSDAMIGEYMLSLYTRLLEADASKRFAGAFKKRFGYLPDDVHATPYLSVQIALRALKATGGDTTPEKLRQAILALDFESCEGRIRFDPKTGCAIRDVYICRIDKIGEEYVMVPVYTYKDIPPRGF